MASAQMVSLRNAWLPRPWAKNEYRQLSCSIRPGSVRPRAKNASRAVPPHRHGHAEHAGAQHDADDKSGRGAARDGPPPGRPVGPAEADHQRVGGQAAGGVERERIGHVRETERAEIGRYQGPGRVETDRRVGDAGDALVRDAPAEPPKPRRSRPPARSPCRWHRQDQRRRRLRARRLARIRGHRDSAVLMSAGGRGPEDEVDRKLKRVIGQVHRLVAVACRSVIVRQRRIAAIDRSGSASAAGGRVLAPRALGWAAPLRRARRARGPWS